MSLVKLEYFFKPDGLSLENSQGLAVEPAWKDLVDRWYQLDETGFALCHAIFQWRQEKRLPEFDRLIFICSGGSNLADAAFVHSGATSPSKFVYTLPNIGPSIVCQVLGWRGPVYCFCVEDDRPQSFLSTFNTALEITNSKNGESRALVIRTSPSLNEMGYRAVYGYYDRHSET